MANTWEQPQLHLAKPQKDSSIVLRGVKNFQSKLYLNNISEISFRIYEYENGERNELYNELEETQLIEALDFDVEWFQIAKVNEKKDDVPVAYKDMTCNSLEDELITKTVYDLNGVFSLSNISDTTKSIMHIITNDISWNIGYISPTLATLYRTLSIDSGRIYSLLTGDLSKSFDCIFKFNREYKTISAYTLDEIGEDTDIVISEQNLLKSWEKNSDKDKIVTKMRVIGGTNTSGTAFDIRKVNFGSDTISNYDYFKPRMSSSLQTALNNWEVSIDTYTSQYDTNIVLLKTYNVDLNTLNNAIIEIKAQISAQDDVMNASLKLHNGYPPISSDSDYISYQNAITQLAILNTQKANKQNEIDSKNSQITSVNSLLDTISSNVDKSNFFNSDLLNELDCFTYVGDDYSDDTFISTDETTSAQEIEMALELKANAEKELHIACRPQPEFKATLKNLWSLYDEKDCVISYNTWVQKFKLGNLVTMILNDDSWTTVRIIGIELDYDDKENSTITFSTRTRLDNSTFNLAEIQAQASRAYSSVSMNKYSWNTAASQTSSNEEFRTNVLTATLNKMQSDPEGKVEFGEYGIKCRDWIESEKAYGLNGMWLNPYRMIFTSDGFKTAGSAYGLLKMSDNTQHMGINTEYLMGKILMTQYTYIENESGNYVFDDSGFTATATVGVNTYSCGINPSTPAEIFNIKVNGSNKFYIDTVNNRINAELYLNAIGGTLGSLTVTGTLTGGILSGTTVNTNSGNIGGWAITTDGISSSTTNTAIEIYNGSNHSMKLNYKGLHLFDALGGTNQYLGGIVETYNSEQGVNGMCLVQAANAEYLAIGYSNATDPSSPDATISTAMYYSQNGVTALGVPVGFTFLNNIDMYGFNINAAGLIECTSLSINGYSAITALNIGNQSVNYASSAYSASVISGVAMGLSNSLSPMSDSSILCGSMNYRWSAVYAASGTIVTSDRNKKNSFKDLDDRYIAFFDLIKPQLFKFNEGSSNRFHTGFVSQDIEQSMMDCGILDTEFAGFIKEAIYEVGDSDTTSPIIGYNYALRYEEFIPILVQKIKSLESIIKTHITQE